MKSVALATLLVLSPSGVEAQGTPLYSDVEVANYYGLIRETFASYAQLLSSDDLALIYPERGATSLSIYSYADQSELGQLPDRDTVGLPPETFLFLDDVFGIQAWYQQNGCDPLNVFAYLWAVLNQHLAMGPPYDAFGLDRAAMPVGQDGPLSAVSLFLLAHEIGHVRLRHDPFAQGRAAEAAEQVADAYALDRLGELRYRNAGALAAYFNVAVFLDAANPTRVDGVHPVTPTRLNALADAMVARAASGDAALQQGARQEAEALRQVAAIALPDEMAAAGEILMAAYPASQWAASCVKP